MNQELIKEALTEITPAHDQRGRLRYEAFEAVMPTASIMRLLRSTHLISELRERKMLADLHPYSEPLGLLVHQEVQTADENSTQWEMITLNASYYEEILASADAHERELIHNSTLRSLYSRSMDLVTDFLKHDEQISIEYPEQNLNRALNRFILLEQLEILIKEKYQYKIY